MPTQVCVYNSAPILRGQHFRVKIVDATWLHTGRAGLHCWKQTTDVSVLLVLAQEAHHLQGDGFHTSLIRDGITADLEAEFTATFGGESSDDLDYLYSFQKAVPWRLSPCMKRILKGHQGRKATFKRCLQVEIRGLVAHALRNPMSFGFISSRSTTSTGGDTNTNEP